MEDSFDIQSVGRQFNSQKETLPSYSFGSSTRDRQANKVFLSKKHEGHKAIMVSPGPLYNVPSTIGEGPKSGFGTDEARKHDKAKYPDSSVDLTCSTVDSQTVKFHSTKGVHFGTESRMYPKNAEILRTNPTLGIARESPGALEYSPKEEMILKAVPEYSFGPKNGLREKSIGRPAAAPKGSTPRTLGPGSHTQPAGIGTQPNSKLPSAPAWSMGTTGTKTTPRQVARLVLDTTPDVSSLGRQVVSSARSAPICSFSKSGRDMVAKTGLVLTQADKGPAGQMPPLRLNLSLPPPEKPVARVGL